MWQSCLNRTGKTTRATLKSLEPRLFFSVSAGAMDSMVNHYTAARRRRSDDAYTPNGRHGARPDYPTIVYTQILKRLFPDTPVVVGGIEASLRRVSHYDYWADRLRPSILTECGADMLIYGMGERPIVELCKRLENGSDIHDIDDIRQTVVLKKNSDIPKQSETDVVLHSFEQCLKSKNIRPKTSSISKSSPTAGTAIQFGKSQAMWR